MADLDGGMYTLNDLTAADDAVIHRREAVEHGAAQPDGLPDAVLRLLIAVLTGVAVDGGGQEIGLALVLEVLHELDVLGDHRHAGPGLHQGLACRLGRQQLFGENALVGHGLVIGHRLLQVNALTGGPLGQHFLAQPGKLPVGDPLILNIHAVQAPFSSFEAPPGDTGKKEAPWRPRYRIGPPRCLPA